MDVQEQCHEIIQLFFIIYQLQLVPVADLAIILQQIFPILKKYLQL